MGKRNPNVITDEAQQRAIFRRLIAEHRGRDGFAHVTMQEFATALGYRFGTSVIGILNQWEFDRLIERSKRHTGYHYRDVRL